MFGTSTLRTRWQSPPGHPPLPSLNREPNPVNVPTNIFGIPKNALPAVQLPKRYLRAAIFGALLIFSAVFFYANDVENQDDSTSRERPLFEEWILRESQLPQHDPSLRPPEGRKGKFLWASHPGSLADLPTVVQDMVIGAYLAHSTGRAFVFENITLAHPPHSVSSASSGSVEIPASALIAGPITGGHLPLKDPNPRAVSKSYFETVCSRGEQNVVRDVGGTSDLTQYWIKKLGGQESRCVVLHSERHMTHSSPHILPYIWPQLAVSPVVKDFRWSSLVHQAFDENKNLFLPPAGLGALPVVGVLFPESSRYSSIPGLLVIHVPYIDQQGLCAQAANKRTGFTGFNSLPILPDQFEIPPPQDSTSAAEKQYQRHCSPTTQIIVAKIQELRGTPLGKNLRNLHLITDADEEAVSDLKAALRSSAKWDKVSSSRDLVLDAEQKYVAEAVDIMIGQRAKVFVGNGFSSLSSAVALLRSGHGSRPNTIRFW